MAKRSHRILVSLNDAELGRLDELRGPTARAVYLRGLVYEPPNATVIATHTEALALLSQKAREGSITPPSRLSGRSALRRTLETR